MKSTKTWIQVRFSDIDIAGHINNTYHLNYIETARIEFLDKILGTDIDWKKTGLILARTEIDYRSPGRFRDKIHILTSCTKLGTKSFELDYKIVREDDSVIAEAKTVMVCFDYELNRPIEIPESWRIALS